ncbi:MULTISPECIES: MFS transporter [unclassified Nocardioides]|uniref:MFS transporter n=1 Tax=unclassified Nocardioides TaxID=2615069 RepID=UPI0006FC53E4|nr:MULTISPECIES: MFS transporter [unclassified Nocardioides]KQY55498.1 hypothetical protein ASD30_16490 [Nocardioides sp. Root140]KRF12765.1 hypothetical protein ASH02_14635 [Nocardioides sp. Soil796]
MTVTNDGVAHRRRALLAGSIGVFVEWFDFIVYAYSAPVIATLFFPQQDRSAALLATFGLFGVAFVVRPFGGYFFGNLGDKIGRRNTLSLVVLLMGGATMCIGVLPTYASIGLLAPGLLLLCRLVQGFSAGGENAGAFALIAEYAPEGRRGLWLSSTVVMNILPAMAAAFTVLLVTSSMSADSYAGWGWRMPFLIGGVLGVIGLYLRRRLEETPAFLAVQERDQVEQAPAARAIRSNLRGMAFVFGLSALNGLAFYLLTAYLVTYLTETVGLARTTALLANFVVLGVVMAVVPLAGLLSDRVGRRPLMAAGAATLAVLVVPGFHLLTAGGLTNAILGQLVIGVGLALFAAPYVAAQVELFPTRTRYSAISISYNIAYALFAGTGPFVSAFLVSRTGLQVAPGIYLAVVAGLVFLLVLALPETYRRPLLQGEESGDTASTSGGRSSNNSLGVL